MNRWTLALVALIAANVLLFGTPLYRFVLDPSSSTGSFEAARQALSQFKSDSKSDVLVVGDSRIYSGLDPSTASKSAGRGLRFVDGSVPGTTPRCWYYFLQTIDPTAKRFRALVIPVDTYGDDDGAIGSIDGDYHLQDLHYVVFAVEPSQIPKLAGSFPDLGTQLTTGIDVLLRGPILRDDIQAFAADPAGRFAAIGRAQTNPAFAPLAAHPRAESLRGMRVDFTRGTIAYPPGVSADGRTAMADQVLRVARPSPSYAKYRREWLYPIVRRYASAGVPVVFVRIPTRPAHRYSTDRLSGTLAALANGGAAQFLPSEPYLALERPELFADHDHLNSTGSELFSEQLGRDVARALSAPSSAPSFALDTSANEGLSRSTLPWLHEAVAVGEPLQFQSFEFWIFIAVLALLFWAGAKLTARLFCASPAAVRRSLLLIASYYFYSRWNSWYVIFLAALTLSDFGIGLALQHTAGRRRRALLAAGVAANLGFLGSLKYANFTTGTLSALFGMHNDPWLVNWIVPIGISFHTFQSISYLVDVYRGKTPAIRNLWDYALYLAFFPQLLSGPIVRAGLFFGELLHWKPPTPADVAYAGGRITFGLFKKVAIADQFAPVVDAYFNAMPSHPGAPAAWTAMFAFSMQIYFDFSAYTDIAIGTARLFGFVFPENFNLPYLATSVTDFWHRWHITLSTWLRDYLYIPLGGSRDGLWATLRNLTITMLLGGLWHGAQWTFVAWGGLHGLYLALERLTGIGHKPASAHPVIRGARALLTFIAVTLAWVLFRAQSFPQAIDVFRSMFSATPGASMITGWCAMISAAVVLFAVARVALGDRAIRWSWKGLPQVAQAGAIAAILLGVELLSWPGTSAPFIYFKF